MKNIIFWIVLLLCFNAQSQTLVFNPKVADVILIDSTFSVECQIQFGFDFENNTMLIIEDQVYTNPIKDVCQTSWDHGYKLITFSSLGTEYQLWIYANKSSTSRAQELFTFTNNQTIHFSR